MDIVGADTRGEGAGKDTLLEEWAPSGGFPRRLGEEGVENDAFSRLVVEERFKAMESFWLTPKRVELLWTKGSGRMSIGMETKPAMSSECIGAGGAVSPRMAFIVPELQEEMGQQAGVSGSERRRARAKGVLVQQLT